MDVVAGFEFGRQFGFYGVVGGIGYPVVCCGVFASDGMDDDLVVCVFLDTEGFEGIAESLHLSAKVVMHICHHLAYVGSFVGRALRLEIDCTDDELGIRNRYP